MIVDPDDDDNFIEIIPNQNVHEENSITQKKLNKRKNVDNEMKRKIEANKRARDAANRAKKEVEQQATGFYRQQELSVVMEGDLYRSTLGGEIAANILFNSESKNYGLFSIEATVSGLCRWTYRNYLEGGNGTIGEDRVITLPLAMIIYPPQKFIEMAISNKDGTDFSAFISEMHDIRERLVNAESCPHDVKIVLILVNIHEESLQYQRKTATDARANKQKLTEMNVSTRIDESIAFLQYDENVDVTCRKNATELAQFIEATTRTLGEQLYGYFKTGADTLRRLPCRPVDCDTQLTSSKKEAAETLETWIHMLQVIPGVSRARAEVLTRHYPTCQRLITALNDEKVPAAERELMLQDKLDPGKKCKKLAKQLYKVFTCKDPSVPLSDDI